MRLGRSGLLSDHSVNAEKNLAYVQVCCLCEVIMTRRKRSIARAPASWIFIASETCLDFSGPLQDKVTCHYSYVVSFRLVTSDFARLLGSAPAIRTGRLP